MFIKTAIITAVVAVFAGVMTLPAWATSDKVGDKLCKNNPQCKVIKPESKTPEQVATEIQTARNKALGR